MLQAAALFLAALNAPAAVAADVDVAVSWLGLLDTQNWDKSWDGSDKLFRSNLTQEQWTKTAQAVRDPLGAVSSRVALGVTKAQSLPGAPDGEYEVRQYRTVFANKANSVETVVLAREGEEWKVVGYFIR